MKKSHDNLCPRCSKPLTFTEIETTSHLHRRMERCLHCGFAQETTHVTSKEHQEAHARQAATIAPPAGPTADPDPVVPGAD